jgi:preprotein translocase SecE subunit
MRQIIKFLQEVRTEFKNISWPKKEALIQLTFVVISISFIISLILGGFDFLFTQSIALLGRPTTNIQTTTVPTGTATVPTAGTNQLTPTIKLLQPTVILNQPTINK